jgi:outer membrane lipoprotein-sorting protein
MPVLAQEAAPSAAAVAKDIAAKIGKVSGFTANIETGEAVEGEGDGSTVSSLMVSRLYGWKLTYTGQNPYTIITDFETFYQYFPQEKRVMKTTADSPEIKAMLTKPVTDMNPIALLDAASLRYLGQEKVAGETVYHVEGTTQSQLMPGGPVVRRNLAAWLSVEDGLPRKTVESVGMSTGTTVYRDVKVNPTLKPEDFAFTPPAGVTVIDTNEQIRKMEQQMSGNKPTPAGKP